jgi:hypothetical protein
MPAPELAYHLSALSDSHEGRDDVTTVKRRRHIPGVADPQADRGRQGARRGMGLKQLSLAVFGAGSPVDHEHGLANGHALALVDGYRVGEGDVFLGVDARDGHFAAAVQGCQL